MLWMLFASADAVVATDVVTSLTVVSKSSAGHPQSDGVLLLNFLRLQRYGV
jgi:hypothetical protein